MNDETIFDPLLGRLRTTDHKTIIQSGGSTTNNINNRIGAGTGTALPATGSDGDIFYDTDDAVLYIWANNMWNAISGGTTTGGADIFGLAWTRNLA